MKNNIPKPSQGNNQTMEPKNNMAFDIEICPDSIKKTRKALGLTVDHFAWLLGVSPSSIFRYENTGVPTVHHGTLTRKLHLLNFWLNQPESADIMTHLLMVKDGLPSLAGLLEVGGVLIVQDPAETRGGGNHKGQSGKSPPAKAGAKAESKKAEITEAPASPEAEAAPPKNGLRLPSMVDLAKRCFRAFNLAAGVLEANENGFPILNHQAEGGGGGAGQIESEAKRLEAEAALIEAQARKLEAETRKFEAEARMAKAKKSLED
jgi:transcriptional regulator with XRE-family HTH domain